MRRANGGAGWISLQSLDPGTSRASQQNAGRTATLPVTQSTSSGDTCGEAAVQTRRAKSGSGWMCVETLDVGVSNARTCAASSTSSSISVARDGWVSLAEVEAIYASHAFGGISSVGGYAALYKSMVAAA